MKRQSRDIDDRLGTFEIEKKEQEEQEVQYRLISRSSIKKQSFYTPEPDNYHSDLIDF